MNLSNSSKIFSCSFQFQYTKPGFMTSVEPSNDTGLICLLTTEQKLIKYEKMKRKMIKSSRGRIDEDEKRNLSEKVQDLLQWWDEKCPQYTCDSFKCKELFVFPLSILSSIFQIDQIPPRMLNERNLIFNPFDSLLEYFPINNGWAKWRIFGRN